MSSQEHPLLRKAVDGFMYVYPGNIHARSELMQDIGRIADRAIGIITQNPCRGCDLFYEDTHNKPRDIKDGILKVAGIEFDSTEYKRDAVVFTCRDVLGDDLKGTARFEVCSTRLAQITE